MTSLETIDCFLDVVPKIIKNIGSILHIDTPRARSFDQRIDYSADGGIFVVRETTPEEKVRDKEFATLRNALIFERTALVTSLPNPGNIIEVFLKYERDPTGLYEVHDLLSREKPQDQLPEPEETRIDWTEELPKLDNKWLSVRIDLRVLKDHLLISPEIPTTSERRSLNRQELGVKIKEVLDKERGKEWTASDLKAEIELDKSVKTSDSSIKKTRTFQVHLQETARNRCPRPKVLHSERPIESKSLSPERRQ